LKERDLRALNSGETILGIDPGGEVIGFGVLRRTGNITRMVACGASRARKGEDVAEKLCRIYSFVRELVEKYRPDVLAVEDIFYGKNAQSLKSIGQVRGVVILAGAQAGLAIHEYSPREVKKAVVGRGDASKEQVQKMIQALLGLSAPPKPHDSADALAIAICYSHRRKSYS